MNLDIKVIIFLVVVIVCSFVIGTYMRKKMKFIKINTINKKKINIVLTILLIGYLIEFIYARNIPIISIVVQGNSYLENNFNGIPILHNFISSFALYYSMYLSYLFFCAKDKKILINILLVNSFFIVLLQRQNIMISILFFLNIGLSANINEIKEKMKKNSKTIVLIFVLIAIFSLYIFGILGNIRYGDSWGWNDSTMISELGKMNSNYPKLLPKEFFWSYVYIVTPLVNLNYNIVNRVEANDIKGLIRELIPDFIGDRVYVSNKIDIDLPVKSLNASTAYVRAYINYGIFGMILIFCGEIIICLIIINSTYKYNKEKFIVACNACGYFLIFSFFVNTFTYSITSLILLWCILNIRKIKI